MKILVINLTRFGDLLQTQPVLSGFKAKGHEVGLVCLENFSSAGELLSGVDRIFPLPGARFLAGLNRDWRHGFKDLWEWVESGYGGYHPDLVVNLTSSIPARLMARMARSEQRGFCLDENGFGFHTNAWAAFLMASSRHRGASPYNLVDLFKRAAELPDDRRELSLTAPESGTAGEIVGAMRSEAPRGARGFVALQLGASSEVRRWPTANFAAVAEKLWQEQGLCSVLLGAKSEKNLGDKFSSACRTPHVNLIGRTSLTELARVLAETRLLLTNDTGTMHLAAGLDVPVAAIFLATAQPWDTGPYKSGCLCMEPDLDCHPCGFSGKCPSSEICRQTVTPQSVLLYLHEFFAGGRWTPQRTEGLRAWRSAMDEQGFMDLESLSGHEAADRSLWIAMQRAIYRQFIDRGETEGLAWQGAPPSKSFSAGICSELKEAEKILFLMLEQARAIEQAPMAMMRKKFMSNWQRLTSRLQENQQLSVLGDLWQEQSHAVSGDAGALQALVARYRTLVSTFIGFLQCSGMNIE